MNVTDPLITYLARHDAPCPGCFRNLRGQVGAKCPACNSMLSLGSVRTWHDMHGDALTNPMPVPGSPESLSVEAYLAKYDVKCLGCGYNLRGLQQSTCPECAREIRLQEFTENPRPKYQKRAAAEFMVLLNVIPLLVISIDLIFGTISAAQDDMKHNAFFLTNFIATIGMAWFVITRVKTLLRRSLLYFVAINPMTIIAALAFLSTLLKEGIFG